MIKPKVSIILPTYNNPDGLKRAVESVLIQDYKNYELILMDYGDTPESYLNIYDILYKNSNIIYVDSFNPTVNLSGIYNQGLEIADGYYLSFLNDFSIFFDKSLSDLIETSRGTSDFVFGKALTVDYTTGKQIYNSFSSYKWEKNKETIQIEDTIPLSSVLIKKEFLNSLGGFDKDLKRSFPLNMWNRVFHDFLTKIIRTDHVVSQIFLNDPKDTQYNNPIDIDFTNIFIKEYPLKNYWTDIKSVSFNYPNFNVSPQFNTKKGSWISTALAYDTDVLVQDNYAPELLSFGGDLIYFYDYRNPVNTYLKDNCKAVITPVSVDTLSIGKPRFILRPCISEQTLESLDNVSVPYPRDLKIGCPDISEDNFDFFVSLLPELYSRFRKITIYHNDNIDIWHRLGNYDGLRCEKISFSDYKTVKEKQLSLLLSINPDFDNYVTGYTYFIMSTILNTPFVSTSNVAFIDLLEDKKHFFICNSGFSLANACELIKDLFIRKNLLENARVSVYTELLNITVVDKLINFLNTIYEKKGITYNVDVSQLDSNFNFYLKNTINLTQAFTCQHDGLKAIEIFLNSITNFCDIKLTLRLNNVVVTEVILPYYKLKDRGTVFDFEAIPDSSGKEFKFSLESINLIGNLEYIDSVKSVGNLWENNTLKRACLKFQTIY